MKILLTGGAGYIGSLLATELVNKGHKLTVIDRVDFNLQALNHLFYNKNFEFIRKDLLKIKFNELKIKKYDLVIPLAALVGHLCVQKPRKQKINQLWIEELVDNLKKPKIIYPTTNSGYGVGEKDKYCNENSPLKPISLYGKTKVASENVILSHNNSISFRLATIFGCSYRMRTDLMVNNFTLRALKEKKLEIFEPHFRRNFIHIRDVINAFMFSIENFNKMKGEVFNLGLSNANLTKLELANKIKKYIPHLKIIKVFNRKDPDQRDYFVSNKKIESMGFKAKINLDQGILELLKLYNVNKNFVNNY